MDDAAPAPPPTSEERTAFPAFATPYTAPCRQCGTRLRLTDDELLRSLSSPPVCWPCDTLTARAADAGGD